MLNFTKKKFLSLPEKNQYKKASDIIKYIILYCPDNWESYLKKYNEITLWMDKRGSAIPNNILSMKRLMEAYLYWRREAGLGPEAELLNKFRINDSEIPKGSLVNWSVLLHNIRSGYNVGSAIRTVDCFGLSSVHISGCTPDINNKSLKSASMGAEAWVPFKRWNTPFKYLSSLDNNTYIVALETSPGAQDIQSFSWPSKGVIIVGNEELGIPPEILKKADCNIHIPMHGRKASLNVSNALSITLFHLRSSIMSQGIYMTS